MIQIPPDWKDPKLWEILGNIPEEKVGSNFLYMVRQKLTGKFRVRQRLFSSFFSFSWATRFALGAACMVVLFTFLHQPELPRGSTAALKKVSVERTMELAQLAQHFELIQDLEVIKNLDQLE